MEVRFDNIGYVLNNMTERQIRLAMDVIAVSIKNREVIDKFDFMDAVKIGLSLLPLDE